MSGVNHQEDENFQNRLWRFAVGEPDIQLEEHLVECARCQRALHPLRHLARYSETAGGTVYEPPASLVVQMSTLLRTLRPDLNDQRGPAGFRVQQWAQRVVATLVLDTGATPQLAGFRSGRDVHTWQVAFVSEVADLDLELSRSGGQVAIVGQLGMDTVPPGLRIHFVPAGPDPPKLDAAGTVMASIEAQGYFRLSLPAAEWVAMVEMDDTIVMFPGLSL